MRAIDDDSHDRANGASYEIGYCKPPVHTRFKPGQSGNPKGKPKGLTNYKTDARKFIAAPVRVTVAGKPSTVSRQMAALMVLWDEVMKRDARALSRFLDMVREVNSEELTHLADAVQSEEDQKILENYKARLLKKAKTGGES